MARDVISKNQKAEKKRVIDLTKNVIEANASVMPNPDYRAKDVFAIKGVGDIFGGNYYVKRARHVISTSGYSVDLELANVDHVLILPDDGALKPAPTPPATQPDKPSNTGTKTYKVVKGDNLSKIARKFGTTWQKIYAINKDKIKNPNLIYPNQVLKIP